MLAGADGRPVFGIFDRFGKPVIHITAFFGNLFAAANCATFEKLVTQRVPRCLSWHTIGDLKSGSFSAHLFIHQPLTTLSHFVALVLLGST
jgi:hypothetical protein